jgi:tRNA(His) guanylyltransferase
MKKDSLGDRMKKNYEDVNRHILPGHMPTIIRIDGRSFRTVTAGLSKPSNLIESIFNHVALAMVKEIANTKLAYLQSDEISFLMHPYQTFETQPFFENNIQKMVSVASSMATFHFLKQLKEHHKEIWSNALEENAFDEAYYKTQCAELEMLTRRIITFDARAFVVPECEVNNYFYWRQLDTIRNSVSMHAQQRFSANELHRKNRDQMLQMMKEKGFDWEKEPTNIKRGRCVLRNKDDKWIVDNDIPMFSAQPSYIQSLLPHP